MVIEFLEERSDIILGSGMVSQYLVYKEWMKILGFDMVLSKPVGFYEMNTIAAKVSLGLIPMFAYFKCFSLNVWILLFVSMLSLALVSKLSTNKTRLKSFRFYFWNYSTLLLSKSMNDSIVKSVPYLILSIWLISSLFTSIQFMAHFYDFMVTTVPVIIIKTLEDLSQRTDMRIIVRGDSSLAAFTHLQNSSLAEALGKQLDPYYDFRAENITQILTQKLPNGLTAYINERLILILDLIKHFQSQNISLDSVYISRESATFEPYFFFLNKNLSQWALHLLNQM